MYKLSQGSYTFSGQKFKDFPGPYFEIPRIFFSKNFPQAKQNALFGFLSPFRSHDLYPYVFQPFVIKMAPARHCDIQLNPQNKYRNARKRELQKMCKPDMHCALVPQLTYTKRASGMTRSVSMHYMSISRMLYFVYSIKSQGLSRTKINFKYFQGLEIRLTYIHILLDHSLNRAFQGQ